MRDYNNFNFSRLAVVKGKSFGSHSIFPAISPILTEAGLDVSQLEEVTLLLFSFYRKLINFIEIK